jgi:NADPH:quinone reductase-like Zn-dependent oxidoreductase
MAGGYAEYVTVPADELAHKPVLLDHQQAAALPLAALTAWQCLVQAARLEAGDRVLIHRAAGGVGHLAVQIAKAHGAHVIALASAAKHDFVRSLGADELIDYRDTDFTETVGNLDIVLDSTGQGFRSLRTLRPGGVLVTIRQHHDHALAANVDAAGRRFAGVLVAPDRAALQRIAGLVTTGGIRPHVAQTLPLDEVVKAHELLDSAQSQGKIVLTL